LEVPYVRCTFLFHPVHPRWSVRCPRRPTAERLLAAFGNLHLLVLRTGDQVQTRLVEPLSPVQRYILELLHLTPSCYDLTGAVGMTYTGGIDG
jgi:hypothetical protein